MTLRRFIAMVAVLAAVVAFGSQQSQAQLRSDGDILKYLSEAAVTKEETPARWNQKLTAALSASVPTL